MNYKQLKTNFERELILVLVLGMKKKNISEIRAKKISKVILEIVKSTDSNTVLLNEISKICPQYPEIMDAYIKIAKEHEVENVIDSLKKVREEVGKSTKEISMGGDK